MKNALYPENRVVIAEAIRKNLSKTFKEKVLQDIIEFDNGEIIITYLCDSYVIKVKIQTK